MSDHRCSKCEARIEKAGLCGDCKPAPVEEVREAPRRAGGEKRRPLPKCLRPGCGHSTAVHATTNQNAYRMQAHCLGKINGRECSCIGFLRAVQARGVA